MSADYYGSHEDGNEWFDEHFFPPNQFLQRMRTRRRLPMRLTHLRCLECHRLLAISQQTPLQCAACFRVRRSCSILGNTSFCQCECDCSDGDDEDDDFEPNPTDSDGNDDDDDYEPSQADSEDGEYDETSGTNSVLSDEALSMPPSSEVLARSEWPRSQRWSPEPRSYFGESAEHYARARRRRDSNGSIHSDGSIDGEENDLLANRGPISNETLTRLEEHIPYDRLREQFAELDEYFPTPDCTECLNPRGGIRLALFTGEILLCDTCRCPRRANNDDENPFIILASDRLQCRCYCRCDEFGLGSVSNSSSSRDSRLQVQMPANTGRADEDLVIREMDHLTISEDEDSYDPDTGPVPLAEGRPQSDPYGLGRTPGERRRAIGEYRSHMGMAPILTALTLPNLPRSRVTLSGLEEWTENYVRRIVPDAFGHESEQEMLNPRSNSEPQANPNEPSHNEAQEVSSEVDPTPATERLVIFRGPWNDDLAENLDIDGISNTEEAGAPFIMTRDPPRPQRRALRQILLAYVPDACVRNEIELSPEQENELVRWIGQYAFTHPSQNIVRDEDGRYYTSLTAALLFSNTGTATVFRFFRPLVVPPSMIAAARQLRSIQNNTVGSPSAAIPHLTIASPTIHVSGNEAPPALTRAARWSSLITRTRQAIPYYISIMELRNHLADADWDENRALSTIWYLHTPVHIPDGSVTWDEHPSLHNGEHSTESEIEAAMRAFEARVSFALPGHTEFRRRGVLNYLRAADFDVNHAFETWWDGHFDRATRQSGEAATHTTQADNTVGEGSQDNASSNTAGTH